MAQDYIVKALGLGTRNPVSPLARAPFDRQRDIYKLAKMGNADSRRMWNDFAAEAPELARLVIADVQSDKVSAAEVTKSVDKRLRKAEKSAKLTKREKQEIMRTPALTPEQRAGMAFINSPNPADRTAAEKLLGIV